VGNLTST